VDQKLNYLQQMTMMPTPALTMNRSTAEEPNTEEQTIIRRMASTDPSVRAKGNYLRCIEALGFPVTTSAEDVGFALNVVLLFSKTIHLNKIKFKV
jgi:hypothetical protein